MKYNRVSSVGLCVALILITVPSIACDDTIAVLKLGNTVVKAELANTPELRQKGLMFRKNLGANRGMWFVMRKASTDTFWMRNTYVPLDILFVGPSMTIVHVHEGAKPLDETLISSPIPYWFVLEVPAGFVKKHGIKSGDMIENRTPKC